MNTRYHICGLISGYLFLSLSWAAAGDDQPLNGLLYNTKEMSALTFDCDLSRADRMTCKFTQTAVRRKMNSTEAEKKLAEFDALSVRERTPDAKTCDLMRKSSEILEGKRKPDHPMSFKDPRDRAAAERTVRNFVRSCDTGNLEFVRQEVKAEHEQDTRTCRVSANNYEQTFRRVSDPVSKKFTWVVEGVPEGACGLVQLSRFEPDVAQDTDITFWNYVARKAITNPAAMAFPGVRCSDLDEQTYVYSWKFNDALTWADCEKIEFSVF